MECLDLALQAPTGSNQQTWRWIVVSDPDAGSANVTTILTLTFLTAPTHPFDKIREMGRTRWWHRRWAKALRRMRDLIESGADSPRAEVAGGDRQPSGIA